MAIFIEVVAAYGKPPETPQRAEFAEAGGSIGRAEDNHLRLADAQRHISRYHARITHRLNRYFILDTGSATPVVLNSQAIGNGREAEIRPGDELRIGHYLLHVTAPADAGSTQVARDALISGHSDSMAPGSSSARPGDPSSGNARAAGGPATVMPPLPPTAKAALSTATVMMPEP